MIAQQEALRLAELGFKVFPANKDDKTPMVPLGTSWKDIATTDKGTILAWWTKNPDALIAMPMVGDTVAIDVDDPARFSTTSYAKQLPPTASQTTRRGGAHYFYRTDGHKAYQTVGGYDPSFDTRVGGISYVIVWEENKITDPATWAEAPAFVYDDPPIKAFASGGQHDQLVSMAGTLLNKGVDRDTMQKMLWAMAQEFVQTDPSRPWRERHVEQIVRDAFEKWDAKVAIPIVSKAVWLADIDASPPPDLLIDRLHPKGHTILFGNGGVGKGALASYWLTKLTKLGYRVLIVDFENNDTEWASRTRSLGLDGLATRYMSPTETLWGAQDAIKAEVEAYAIDYLVIDSMIPALGDSDYASPEGARKYAAALIYIGKPALSLAHVNRAGDHSSPFGSAFHKNLCRLMWSIEDKEDGIKVLTQRKNNNYAPTAPQRVELVWENKQLMAVVETPYALVLSTRIGDVIEFLGPSTPEEIAAQLNSNLADGQRETKPATVRTILNRGEGKQFMADRSQKKVKWLVLHNANSGN